MSLVHFCAFVYWEAKVTRSPILPFDIWTAPSMLPLVIVVFFVFMSFGIFGWYTFQWNLIIRNNTLLNAAASAQPLTVGGAFACIAAGWLIPRLEAQYILAISAASVMVSNTLLASMPAQQLYWKQEF